MRNWQYVLLWCDFLSNKQSPNLGGFIDVVEKVDKCQVIDWAILTVLLSL